MYKIVMVDLDGTLLDDNKNVSKKNIEMINKVYKEKGVIFVIATGKNISDISYITDAIGEPINQYIIASNGAVIKNNVKDDYIVKKYLTDDIKYYDDDAITNRNKDFQISEIVREKLFNLTNDEVPHSITCIVEDMKKDKNKYIINVLIIVDRDSLKKIVIGKNGEMLKKVGTMARKEIEELLDATVYLELYVKTIKKWRDREKYLNELGYYDSFE